MVVVPRTDDNWYDYALANGYKPLSFNSEQPPPKPELHDLSDHYPVCGAFFFPLSGDVIRDQVAPRETPGSKTRILRLLGFGD